MSDDDSSAIKGQGLASSGDHFKQSDVMFWGVVALVVGAFAVLGSNMSGLLPANIMTALHSSRLDGGNLNHLRTQVAELRDEASRIRTENDRLQTMLTLAEQDQGAVTRRVGAIESTLPALLENARGANIDSSLVTSAIGATDETIIETEGGTVAVSHRPMNPPAVATIEQEAIPAPLFDIPDLPILPGTKTSRVIDTTPISFGVALGPQVTVRDAFVAWKDITTKSGPLLIGLGPLLSGNAGVEQQRLVAGPLADYSQAEEICARMIRIGISCLPVPYSGNALPQ